MLTPEQWGAVEDTIHRVCNRESDYERIFSKDGKFAAAIVSREEYGISLKLRECDDWSLEPEDIPDE